MFETIGQHLKNEASVIGQVMANTPSAIWDEITSDWKQEPSNLLLRGGASLGMGAGLGVLLSRSPVLGSAAVAIPSLYFGLKVANAAGSVLGRAWDASTPSSRQMLVQEASFKLGREGATTLETMPAFMLGGAGGMAISRNVSALDRLALRVTASAELPARRLLPETVSWVGPGVEQFPKSLVSSEGNLDLLKLSQMLAQRHPWKGVEVIRSIRLSDMKASRAMPGTAIENELGFFDAPRRVMFHTHPPYLRAKESGVFFGARPSVGDLAATMDTGIIHSGDLTTIYKGAFEQQIEQRAAGEAFSPILRALVLDRRNQLAIELETPWVPAKQGYESVVPRPVNFAEAKRLMSNWDGKWQSIQSLTTDIDALSHPDIDGLLKLGTL